MNKHATILFIGVAACCGLLAACGGASSQQDVNTIASDAEPPPTKATELKRNVSKEASSDFSEAVAYYNESAKNGWNENRCSQAASRFEAVASSHAKMVEARYNAGLSYQNCRMMEKAEKQYKAALGIKSDHAPSLSNLGQIYYQGGNDSAARQYWERAVKADAKIVAARANLAWLIIREMRAKKPTGKDFAKMHDEAAGHLSRALAVENANVEAYVLYALLYIEGAERNRSRLALSEILLDKAEKLDDKFAALHNARGLLLLHKEQVAQALTSFQRAASLDPKFAEARMNVALVVLDFRKYGDAEQQFKAVLELDPKNYNALIGMGIAQRGQKKLDEAEETYKAAAKLSPDRADAYFNLGVLYQDFRANGTDDQRKAQSAYRAAAKYFKDARSKPTATESMKRDADENIKTCEKNDKSIEEFLKFQEQAPAS